MPQTSLPNVPAAIKSLLGPEEVELLKIYDELRTSFVSQRLQGLAPHIVVCGDTSAGKSSTLEAISGINFPKHSLTCTRFVTEIRLRRGQKFFKATIKASDSNPPKTKVEAWEGRSRVENLPNIVNEVVQVLGIKTDVSTPQTATLNSTRTETPLESTVGSKSFTDDVLILEIHSSDVFDITLVDLPGLIQNDHDGKNTAQFVEHLNKQWISKENAIILAIINAENVEDNQRIIRLVKEIDPRGERAIPVLTKPDRLQGDEDAQNDRIEKILGEKRTFFMQPWHVLRNRTPDDLKNNNTTGLTDEQMIARDEEFFSKAPWNRLKTPDSKRWGIIHLRARLARVLADRMRKSVRPMGNGIENRLRELERTLKMPSYLMGSDDDMRQTFRGTVAQAVWITNKGIEGKQEDPFFNYNFFEKQVENSKEKGKDGKSIKPVLKLEPRMIRGRLNILYDEFEEVMRTKAHNPALVWPYDAPDDDEAYLEVAMQILKLDSGTEFPDLMDPQRINPLFHNYTRKWKGFADKLVGKAQNLCTEFLEAVLEVKLREYLPKDSSSLDHFNLRDHLEDRKIRALSEVESLEKDRQSPVMTRNKYIIQEMDEDRMKKEYATEKQATRANGVALPGDTSNGDNPYNAPDYYLRSAQAKGRENAAGVRKDNTKMFLTKVKIYYKWQLDIFIDTVIKSVIERHLVRELNTVLSKHIQSLNDRDIDEFWNTDTRKRLMEEKTALETERQQLKETKRKMTRWSARQHPIGSA
ncbi:hypothetical protein P154DRAFT_577402 [Amniculicola lignicola CBS 123094]|uniref:Dynamin-type G domain-containing protein n=1 Tax=Amniculicola lignicola CBS 123094 TaxID=1392246 RepID=A0A6A5WN43_9PLEO|nr:hypothetical protein P154DRAFT_577402 [Amniculicola lignicola CBS 123094]